MPSCASILWHRMCDTKAALSKSGLLFWQVDILSWRNKTQRVHVQVKDICAILSGLVVAQDYKKGQALVVNRNFADNAEWFQVSLCLPRMCQVSNALLKFEHLAIVLNLQFGSRSSSLLFALLQLKAGRDLLQPCCIAILTQVTCLCILTDVCPGI